MLKKSINSASIRLSHVTAAAAVSCMQRKSIWLLAMAVRSLRLWTFFSTSASCFQIEYAGDKGMEIVK